MLRKLGPLLAIILLALVGAGIWFSAGEQFSQAKQVTVKGFTGSEKLPFFQDPEVQEAFAKHGLKVEAVKAGSRQIATMPELKDADFAFPAGVPAASKIKQRMPKAKMQSPFFTPMVIASWQPIALALTNAGLAQKHEGYYSLDMDKYKQHLLKETRWKDLSGNTTYRASKQMLIRTTDVRKSNSAAMYLAVMSNVLNRNEVPATVDDAQRLFPPLAEVFLRQGFVESSSQTPFDDYLVMGMGHTPMLWAYEAQYIGAADPSAGGLPRGSVLIYPNPGILSKHVLVSFTEGGHKLSELLHNDPEIKKLAIKHGFRNNLRADFEQHVQSLNVKTAPNMIDVVEAPSYEVTEWMIEAIADYYQSGGKNTRNTGMGTIPLQIPQHIPQQTPLRQP